MNLRQTKSLLPIAVLLALLALLASLQYKWLGQISDGERERLQKRLEIDTTRFAEDFNREIQNAYFNFQISDKSWRAGDFRDFNERLEFWRSKTAYGDLITDFYFLQTAENAEPLRFDADGKTFRKVDWSEELKNYKNKLADKEKFEPIDKENFALIMPVHESVETVEQILLRNEKRPPPKVELPEKFGYLIIKLNEETIRRRILPDLERKYFSDAHRANYKVRVTSAEDEAKVFFQTQNESINAADARVDFFNLAPENLAFFANRDVLTTIGERKSVVYTKKIETANVSRLPRVEETENSFQIRLGKEPNSRVRIFETKSASRAGGIWTLKVQHVNGSLEQFIADTRRKNLAVSFGILALLGASVVLIFLSAQRAKHFAQKQVDFVSAVSHEFRTPLAVIYSAGENLTDGVVRDDRQIVKYGDLIKREGKKLSSMVEQILEFAGARSGKIKYDFRTSSVEAIVESAIRECEPLIAEKGFTIEKNIAENLPEIKADANALNHSIQNLINNSIKYGNGSRWIKISAENGGARSVKITVEDKGIGISAKEMRRVFEPFYRSKQVVDEQIHGNGLGLSLVKQTVEAHGGKISVESLLQKGSKFIIEIPAEK